MREYRRKWAEANPEKQADAVARHRAANMPKIRRQNVAWKKANPEKLLEQARRRYQADPERFAAEARARRARNPDGTKATRYRSYAKRKQSPYHRLSAAVRAGVSRGLANGVKGTRKTEALLGYSLAELRSHLEKRFAPGMSWKNYGKGGWHVDHVVPLAAFAYDKPEHPDFRRAWALDNLQPLWERDNQRKGARLVGVIGRREGQEISAAARAD